MLLFAHMLWIFKWKHINLEKLLENLKKIMSMSSVFNIWRTTFNNFIFLVLLHITLPNIVINDI